MIVPGLVSVTFRSKTPLEICRLCNAAGLRTIEWGGDIHVPAGDVDVAREVREMSRAHGIDICAYGSYYRVSDSLEDFRKWLSSACALEAPVIRVWLGRKGSDGMNAGERAVVIGSLRSICAEAAEKGIIVAPEFHGGTLTDDPESFAKLLEETADIDNLRFYWQPRWDWEEDVRLATLEQALPRLANMHVFTWQHVPEAVRLPLADGEAMWKKALSTAESCNALLEFVQDDSDTALMRDAATLCSWIEELARS